MPRYNPERFNFSRLSERITFQVLQPNHTYVDNITVWAHVLKDGFTRTEQDNWFKILVREQRALESLLDVGNRIKWKNKLLSIFSWRDPSYEDHGFIEILAKQIPIDSVTSAIEFFKDIVSVHRMITIEKTDYGLTSYEYTWDFNNPTFTNIRCLFSSDANRYVEDKRRDVEHDSLIVKFSADAPIQIEDYIVSPIYGKFKIDMIVKNRDNMLEAYCSRGDVQ
jgi:hypothetical protein